MTPPNNPEEGIIDCFMMRRAEQLHSAPREVPLARSPLADAQDPDQAAALHKAGWICKETPRGLNIWCKPHQYDWFSQANAYHLLMSGERFKQRFRR